MMNPVSPFPAMAALIMAIVTAFFIVKRYGAPPEMGRYTSIDGLRGYLAFGVFLHHACVWFFYPKTSQWSVPPSHLYTHFGQSSVELFFMITGFLFFSKLLDGRARPIDWARLFVSRFLRLVPLYLFAMLLLFLIVGALSSGALNESPLILAKNAVRWLGFTILGAPDLNGVEHTAAIIAMVTWSLPYEWFFYCSLPIFALAVGVRAPLPCAILGAVSVLGFIAWHPAIHHLFSFLAGIAASFLVRSDRVCRFAAWKTSSGICLGCIGAAVAYYPSAYDAAPLLLLSVAFVIIACGNTLFGLLVSPVSRTLGEMAYSIYLLHGIVLFVFFRFVIGMDEAKALSPMTHWLLIAGITPVLIIACFMTFRFIEHPAMQSASAITAGMRARLTQRP